MKKNDIEKQEQNLQQPKLGDLPPQIQNKQLKQQIGKRIRQREIDQIRNMSISEVNSIIDRQQPPPEDGSRLNKIRNFNYHMGITDEDVKHQIKSPGQKHVEMVEQSLKLQKYKMRQISKDPVMAQIKRGKLGTDNFFILFGIFGSLLIPVYVYHKFKKHREDIVNSRIASPEVIRRLDENSPIDLDDVSYHTIHYYNPDRVKEEQAKKKKIADIYKLEKELYF